jgi:serine/threonine-protein kinase RsbW
VGIRGLNKDVQGGKIMASKDLNLKLEIDSQFSNTAPLALAVRGVCQITTMSPVEINRTELCLMEIINNSIEHAYKKKKGNLICIDIHISEDYFTIKVYDWGRPIPEKQLISKPKLSNNSNSSKLFTHGRGLEIVKSLMDFIDYNSKNGTNCFTMIKNLKK